MVCRRMRKVPPLLVPQMCVKPRKAKVSGLPRFWALRLRSARRPNSMIRVFCGCRLQPEPPQTLPKLVQKPLGIRAMLEAHHGVVGIADDDHLAAGMSPPPLVDPQVVDVVQIDVRQDR